MGRALPQHDNIKNVNHQRKRINVIIPKNQSQYQLANFYHGALCSPTIKTLQKAINNDQLLSWPVIEKLNFNKCIIDTKAIHMGHLDQECQNLQLTKKQFTQQLSEKKLETINKILPFTAKAMAYGDLTGSFPYTSSRGAKYLFIMYDYDSNTILIQPLKSKQAHEIK